MKFTSIVALFVLLVFQTSAQAQEISLPSPTAANLGKVADQGVNLFSGKPNISIPLTSIGRGDLAMSISLSYDASGTRVSEIPDWVGSGWALNAGGVITRSMKGMADEDVTNGYHNISGLMGFMETAFSDGSISTAEYASMYAGKSMENHIDDMKSGLTDHALDVFYYNFFGYSGKFILGFDGDEPISIPLNDFDIDFFTGSGMGVTTIIKFVITDANGMKFTFDKVEYSLDQPNSNPTTFSYASAWYLTKIESPSSNNEMVLNYHTTHEVVHKYNNEEYEVSVNPSQVRYSYQKHNRTTLKEIIFQDQKLVFNRSLRTDAKTPSDWTPANTAQEYLLDSIDFFINNTKVRTYDLTYSYPGNRLFLDEVTEKNEDGVALPSHKFTYNNPSGLPDRLNKGIDHWGYFNGKGAYNTEARGFIMKGEWWNTIGAQYQYHDGADRTVDAVKARYGVLEKIEYPTGGSVEYEYESNDYSSIIFPAKINGGLVDNPTTVQASRTLSFISSIESESFSDSNVTEVEVDVTLHYDCNGTYLDFDRLYISDETNPLLNGWHENRDWIDIDHTINNNTTCSTFDSYYGSGGPLGIKFTKTYLLNIGYEEGNDFDFTFDTNLPLPYHENDDTATLTYSVSGVEKVFPSQVKTKGPGLRVKKVTINDAVAGTPDIVKEYKYVDDSDPNKSSGVMYNEPVYNQYVGNPYYPNNSGAAITRQTVTQYVAFGMGASGFAGYERVEEISSSNGKSETFFYSIGDKTAKVFENLDDFRDWYILNTPSNPNIILTPYMGKPKEIKTFNQNGDLLNKVYNIENQTDQSIHHPTVNYFGLSFNTKLGGAANHPGVQPFYSEIPFLANTKVISSIYEGGATPLVTERETEYTSTSHKNPTKVTETNSLTSEKRVTHYKYAHEQYSGMETANMLSQSYSVLVEDGAGTDLNKSWTTWSNAVTGAASGKWLPNEQWVWKSTGTAPATPSTSNSNKISDVERYDASGNPLEIVNALGTRVSYDWSEDGLQPIGIFQDAVSSKVLAHSFAYDGLTGWGENGAGQPFDHANSVATTWEIDNGRLKMTHPGTVGSNWGTDYMKTRLPNELDEEIAIEFDLVAGKSTDHSLTVSAGGDLYPGGNGGSENLLWTSFRYGEWRHYDGSAWTTVKTGFSEGESYHIKIVIDPNDGSKGKVDYYVDGVLMQSNLNGRVGSTGGIDIISFGNYGRSSTTTSWEVDNVRVYPVAALAQSQEVDKTTGTTVAVKNASGSTSRYAYDSFWRLKDAFNPEGDKIASYNYYFSMDGNASYTASDPNKVETIAYTDPIVYTDFSTSTGWTSVNTTHNVFNTEYAGETTVRMGSGGSWESIFFNPGEVDVIARIDFYPDNTTGGIPHLVFDGGGNRFGVHYMPATDSFRIQYQKNSGGSVYPFDFPLDAPIDRWYTIEVSKSGGDLTAWVYPKGGARDPDNSYSLGGFSTSWAPSFLLSGNDNYYYAANFSASKSWQNSVSYLDGIGREVQTQLRGGSTVIATETLYNDRGLPEVASRPIETTAAAFPGFYDSGMLSGGGSFTPGNAIPSSAPVHSYYDPLLAGANEEDYAYSITTYEPSPLARVTESQMPGGATYDVVTTYGLNTTETFATSAQGSVPAKTWAINTLNKTVSEDPNGKKTIVYTDGWGQTIASGVDMSGDSKLTRGSTDLVTEFAYDERGNLVRVEDPRGLATTYTYNTLGQLTEKKLPDQEHPVKYKYDDAGQLRFSQDPNQQSAKQDLSQSLTGGVSVSKTIVVNNDGVLSFNLSWVDLFLGNYSITIVRTENSSTIYSNTVSSENGSIGTQTFNVGPGTYVFTGQAADPGDIVSTSGTFAFESNDIFTYTKYDGLGRPTEVGEYHGGTTFAAANPDTDTFPTTGNTANLNYYYDGDQAFTSGLTPRNQQGRLTKVSYRDLSVSGTSWGHTWYSYNALGLVEWVVQDIPGLVTLKKAEYTYDGTGRLTLLEYQKGVSGEDFRQRYSYDELGRLYKVESSTNGTSWTEETEYLQFAADGQPIQQTLGNSGIQTVDYTYTVQGWLDRINNGSISTATNGDRFGLDLDYFANGNISHQRWRQAGASNQNQLTYSYSYDTANRLTAANFSGSGYGSAAFDLTTVGYDKNGNITNFIRNDNNGSSYPDGYLNLTFEAGTNRLTNIQEQVDYTNWDVDHDASGNMIKNQLQGFTSVDYDWRNLPAQLIAGASTMQYAYDADGNRVRKELTSGVETHYVRGAGGETLAIYEDDVLQFHNILAGGTPIGTWDGSQRRYFLKDHLGSVRTTVDQSGNVDGYDDYYPYGLVMPGRSSNSANPTDLYKFTGHERDNEAGLTIDYMMARNYDPMIGRFMQIDPLSDQFPGWSPYKYVGNNPLKYTDPTGKSCEPWCYDAMATRKGLLDGTIDPKEHAQQSMKQGGALLGVLSIFTPGPEDVVLAGALLTKAGQAVAKWGDEALDGLSSLFKGGDEAADATETILNIDDIDTEKFGVIYRVDGANTESGLPYIGSSDNFLARQNFSADGRNRQGAEIIGTYPKGDRDARRLAEQNAINANQGVGNLDNKRNEIAESKWEEKGVGQNE